MVKIENFVKSKEYLLCLDSDGCAIDGMTVKHLKCFGPCIIEEWQLEANQEGIIEYWNKINLYSLTRGINRFKGILLLLKYIKEKSYISDSIEVFENWVNNTKELSNLSIENEINEIEDNTLRKVLSWSKKVNSSVANLTNEEKLAFEGVRETLLLARDKADIAIISAANAQAVTEEFEFNDLDKFVDVCMTQEYGNKASCINQLIQKGYKIENIIMIGDALGDYQSAKINNISFYPILANQEVDSWDYFKNKIMDKFFNNKYDKHISDELLEKFKENLE